MDRAADGHHSTSLAVPRRRFHLHVLTEENDGRESTGALARRQTPMPPDSTGRGGRGGRPSPGIDPRRLGPVQVAELIASFLAVEAQERRNAGYDENYDIT